MNLEDYNPPPTLPAEGLAPKIENLIRPAVEKAGYELIRVELKQQGRVKRLTIIINKVGGLSVEDCAKVSGLIDSILEKEDLIKTKYFLVVSSPGIK